MSKTPALVVYTPVFHSGYDRLFQQARDLGVVKAYILGPELISQFPILAKEIRQADPEVMVKVIQGLGYFSEVTIATPQDLENLKGPVILTEEQISDELATRYFTNSSVTRLPVFLRWDEKYVSQAAGEPAYTATITKEEFHQIAMGKATLEAKNSSDWFRQVGAALVKDGAIKAVAHNKRMPSPHEPWATGDPRLYMVNAKEELHRKSVLHAEESLIVQCARNGLSTEGAWIYATTFPCPACANMIAESGITRCYFQSGYSDLQGDEILKSHGVEIIKVI